jgi:methionyl-tRNA synthetase
MLEATRERDRAGRARRASGVDGFRYHFLRDQHFGPDGDISFEAMVARYNADLANNFGNSNRAFNMALSYCDGSPRHPFWTDRSSSVRGARGD